MRLGDTARLICRKAFAAWQNEKPDDLRRELTRLTTSEVREFHTDCLEVFAVLTDELLHRKRLMIRADAEERFHNAELAAETDIALPSPHG